MKRILLGLLLGALIFAGAVGAKVINVTNPMTSDLDAATHAIENVSRFEAATVSGDVGVYSGQFSGTSQARGTLGLSTGSTNVVNVDGGFEDPSVACFDLQPGSLYLRRVDATHGELWFHPTDAPCNWTRIAP